MENETAMGLWELMALTSAANMYVQFPYYELEYYGGKWIWLKRVDIKSRWNEPVDIVRRDTVVSSEAVAEAIETLTAEVGQRFPTDEADNMLGRVIYLAHMENERQRNKIYMVKYLGYTVCIRVRDWTGSAITTIIEREIMDADDARAVHDALRHAIQCERAGGAA